MNSSRLTFPRLGRAAAAALALLLSATLAVPALALDAIYLVRHAEKATPWPTDSRLDPLQPLSPEGERRAEALALRLADAGIAAAYTSRTTRSVETAMPLVARTGCRLEADDRSTRGEAMGGFLADLEERHAGDRAVLVVGHSNTLAELLVRLGAEPACYARLGIVEKDGGLWIEGYDGLWKADPKQKGCAALERLTQ